MQERKIYVFGGWDTPVCYNDMYMLDLGKRHAHLNVHTSIAYCLLEMYCVYFLGLMEFSTVKTTGKPPSPRRYRKQNAVLSLETELHLCLKSVMMDLNGAACTLMSLG